jgi:excisionase family DNA binding protein
MSTHHGQDTRAAAAYGGTGRALPAGRRPLAAADVMSAAEVAELLHVSKSTVEDWARRGVVPSKKVGRRRLYIRSKIETLLLEDHAGSVL